MGDNGEEKKDIVTEDDDEYDDDDFEDDEIEDYPKIDEELEDRAS